MTEREGRGLEWTGFNETEGTAGEVARGHQASAHRGFPLVKKIV